MLRASLVVAALIVAFIGSSSRAHAQNQAEMEARRLFRLGQAHYENGQFEEAARTFEEAYRLSPLPRLMFNAYLAYRDMQDLPNSARSLRLFLEGESELDPAERDQLTARLAAIDAAIARMGGGNTTQNTNTQITATTDENGSTTITAETTDTGGGFNPSPVGFIIAGVGVALEIVAIITGVMASSEFSTLSDRCPGDMCPDDQELRDAQSRGQSLAIATDVLWPTGLVAIGVGVALIFVLQEGGDESTTAGFSCTPEGCYGELRSSF